MLGFKLGFGVGPFRAFGTSGPVEALADLGASWGFPGPFRVKWRGAQKHFSLREGCLNPSFSIFKNRIFGTDKSCGPHSFRGPFEAFEAFWWLLAPLGGFLGFPGASGVKWRGAQKKNIFH